MAWFNRSLRNIILTTILAMALTMGFGANLSAQVLTQLRPNTSLSGKLPSQWNFTPPRRGLSVNRQGGATRGDECVEGDATVTALVPASNFGATATAYPTVFWYMPKSSASEVELKVQDSQERELYFAKYALAKSQDGWVVGSPGIMSFSLPAFANFSPLEMDQDYDWLLRVICPPDATGDRSNDIVLGGGIMRVRPDPTLTQRIQQATPQDRVALYANAGLWYETVATLVELRRDRPNDNELAQAWNKLLNSVGLDNTFKKLPRSPR